MKVLPVTLLTSLLALAPILHAADIEPVDHVCDKRPVGDVERLLHGHIH